MSELLERPNKIVREIGILSKITRFFNAILWLKDKRKVGVWSDQPETKSNYLPSRNITKTISTGQPEHRFASFYLTQCRL
jgi:hypothetical protein